MPSGQQQLQASSRPFVVITNIRGKSEKRDCLKKKTFSSIQKKSCVDPKSCLFFFDRNL